MAKALTKKRAGFVKDYKKTGNASLAVKNNFDVTSDDSARSLGSQLLNDPKVKKAIGDLLPDDLLAEKHLALLNKIDNEGEIDVMAVSKGLDMAYKVKGHFAPEKSIQLNISLSEERKQELRDITTKVVETLVNEQINRTA